MYATTKPAALKASWAPGRNAYGEQYSRMAAASPGNDWQHRSIGRQCRRCRQSLACGIRRAGSMSTCAKQWYASIKSDRWAHCVLNYPNVRREDVGLLPHPNPMYREVIPNIKAIFWQGSNWLNQLPNINKQLQAMEKLEVGRVHGFDHHSVRGLGRCVAADCDPLRATRCGASLVQGALLHPSPESDRADWENPKPTCRCLPNCRIGWVARCSPDKFNPRADRSYFQDPCGC